jgi:hypothetical protein
MGVQNKFPLNLTILVGLFTQAITLAWRRMRWKRKSTKEEEEEEEMTNNNNNNKKKKKKKKKKMKTSCTCYKDPYSPVPQPDSCLDTLSYVPPLVLIYCFGPPAIGVQDLYTLFCASNRLISGLPLFSLFSGFVKVRILQVFKSSHLKMCPIHITV